MGPSPSTFLRGLIRWFRAKAAQLGFRCRRRAHFPYRLLELRRHLTHNRLEEIHEGYRERSRMAGDARALPDIFLPGGRLRLELLTDPAAQALAEAMRLARETHWDSLRSPHIFMGLLAVPDAGIHDWAGRLGVELPQLLSQFQEYFHQQNVCPEVLKLHREFFSDNVIRLLRDAQVRSRKNGRRKMSSMDLLISLLSAPRSIVAECFERTGMTAERLTQMAVMAEQSGSGN
jgi:hypothetical protein